MRESERIAVSTPLNLKGERSMKHVEYVFCYPSKFRIRSKADAEAFLTISKGAFWWSDGETDYWMENGTVRTRPVWMRGSIFNPYMDESKGYADLIWKTRKYINAKLKGD